MNWSGLLNAGRKFVSNNWTDLLSTGLSLYGAYQGNRAEGKVGDNMAQGFAVLQSLRIPGLEDLQVELQEYVLQGQITPEEYVAYLQEASAMQGVQVPPDLLNIQYDVLNDLKAIADQGGLTAEDLANIADAKEQILTAARGQHLRTKQEFQERGLGGSGLELGSRLATDSASIQAASKAGLDTAALAQKRALDALKAAGSQANTMSAQDLALQTQKAQAADAINRFNTQARQTVHDNNVGARNTAQAANLREAQRVADANTNVRNQQQIGNANTAQQMYQNELNRARLVSGGYQDLAKYEEDKAGRQGGYLSNISDALGSFGNKDDEDEEKQLKVSDRDQKINVSSLDDSEVSQILDAITGNKYNYLKSSPDFDGDKHVGVIAQEIEKTPLSGVVVEQQGIKKIDTKEAGLAALAMLKSVEKRVRELENK